MSESASRKADHLKLCSEQDVSYHRSALFEDVDLVHEALPEIGFDEVSPAFSLLGQSMKAPLLITAISGGTDETNRLNRDLAHVARQAGVGLGLGSQRSGLEDKADWPKLKQGEDDPLVLLGNIGLAQVRSTPPARLAELARSVDADALCVHLNVAQECFQPEGDRDFRGGLDAIHELVETLPVPVIVKETGCGMSLSTARRLKEAGVRHVDVAGSGGTTWIGVEMLRQDRTEPWHGHFREWGIPTAASVACAAGVGFQTVIASGGVRSGLDAAKALALGADAAGVALPVLKAWRAGGRDGAAAYVAGLVASLRMAMALTASVTPSALRGKYAITGPTLPRWISALERGARP